MADTENSGVNASSKYSIQRVAFALSIAIGTIAICVGGMHFVQNARYASQVSQANCSMKQIGLAAHNFHDTYGHFPPFRDDGTDDEHVTARTSFHTSMLIFLEQSVLANQIDKTIVWSDPRNKKAFSTVLPVCGSSFLGPEHGANGYALAHFVPSTRMIRSGQGIGFAEVTDGTSNTVLTGSVGAAFPAWGDPENGRDPALGFGGGPTAFGGLTDGALIGLADGSVRFISSATDPKIALSLATPASGDADFE